MKLLLLIVLFGITTYNLAFTQNLKKWAFGIELGSSLSRSNLSGALKDDDYIMPYFFIKERYMISSGIVLQYSLNDHLSLNSGVSLLSRSLNVYGFTVTNTNSFERNFFYHIVELPLYGVYRKEFSSTFSLLFKLGASLNFLSSSKSKTIDAGYYADIQPGGTPEIYEFQHNFSLNGPSVPVPSILGGISLENKLNKFGRIQYGVSASYQTQNEFFYNIYYQIRRDGQTYSPSDYNTNPMPLNYIKLNLVYLFPFNKRGEY
jgi:hypothetical protein